MLLAGHEEALRIPHRQHAPHHRVHQREDRRVGADPERQRKSTAMVKPGLLTSTRKAYTTSRATDSTSR